MEGKKIVVLGGGTAGWITALFCTKTFPLASVTLIENTSVGIVGVGEGTVPAFVSMLHFLGLDEFDVMREAGGTAKNGISFDNWNGDNKKYFHGFRYANNSGGQGGFSMLPHFPDGCEKYHLQTLIKEGLDFNEYVYATRLSYRNELDLYNVPISMHMDTFKLGSYLRKIGSERNIVSVDGNFSHVDVDENNFIQKLCLDDGREFECDFVFDCSGFAKLLIGKYYKVPWVSYTDYLPMKKALAFNLEPEQDVKPYTRSIAMKYGWMWQIPVQDRIGAGYVFDSDYLKDEEAIDEAQQFLGQTILNARSIPFNAGSHEKFWVKNCISVGLSSNFVEPLEATSLDAVMHQLNTLREFLNHVFKYNEKSVASYNKITYSGMEGIMHFIYLHYLTKRSDTDFWKTFRERHPVPQKFEETLHLIYENNLRQENCLSFLVVDYLEICNGLDMFKQPIDMVGYENLTPSVAEYKKMNDEAFLNPTTIINHAVFLAGLYGPERWGSPLGPPCDCPPWFHRTKK